MINYTLLKNIITEFRDVKFFAFSDVECGRNKSELFECPSWKWNTNQKKYPLNLSRTYLWSTTTNYLGCLFSNKLHSSDPRERNQRQHCWFNYLEQSVLWSCKYSFLLSILPYIFCQFCQVVHKYLLIEWFLDRVMIEVLNRHTILCASKCRVLPG